MSFAFLVKPADNGPPGLRIADRCGFCFCFKKDFKESKMGTCRRFCTQVEENMVCPEYNFRESGALEL